MNVTETEVSIGKDACIVQNLGPDPVFIGSHDVLDRGIKLATGEVIQLGFQDSAIFIASEGTSDVRVFSR